MSLCLTHAEAFFNAIVGLVLMQGMLWAFGIALALAWKLNICGLCLSYARSFALRMIFARWAR